MKKKSHTLMLFLLILLPGMLPAQFVLRRELNAPRPGDELIKQQVQYKDPGPAAVKTYSGTSAGYYPLMTNIR